MIETVSCPISIHDQYAKYSITCIQRPPEGSNKSDLLQQVVFKCRFYLDDLSRGVVSEQWSLNAVDCLTLFQTTNFSRQVQIEIICRQQNECN